MKGDSYLQFPMCLLSYGDSVEQRMTDLISYSFVEAGRELMAKMERGIPEDEIPDKRSERAQMHNNPSDCNTDLWPHCAAVFGAQAIGITMPSVVKTTEQYERVRQYVLHRERIHGTDPIVRVPKSLCFEVRDGGGMSYREFSVLCAVNSIIGAKQFPVPVRRDAVRFRAMGYKTEAIAKVDTRYRKDKLKPLTDWQVRATLDSLHILGWYARAFDTHARRTTYYSNKMNDAQLREAILKSQTYKQSFRNEHRVLDGKLGEELKKKRANLHKTTTLIGSNSRPPNASTPPPLHLHSTTTETTTEPPL